MIGLPTDAKMALIDFFLHLDLYLADAIALFGFWVYAVLFAIVFAETGLVVAPFLPGDSLLFAVGALGGGGFLNVGVAYTVMLVAAVLGDTVNYWLGHRLGPRVFIRDDSRLFSRVYLERTREFYERHGGKTVVLARFLPILRTFAPFVAGVGRMRYRLFLFYNVLGALIWVSLLVFAGYFFGAIPLVRENFEWVIIGIIGLSLLPLVVGYGKKRLAQRVKN